MMKIKRYLICENNGTIMEGLVKDEDLTKKLKGYFLAGYKIEELRILTIEVIDSFIPLVEHNISLIKNNKWLNEFLLSEEETDKYLDEEMDRELDAENTEDEEDPLFYKELVTGKQLKKTNKKPGDRKRLDGCAFPD